MFILFLFFIRIVISNALRLAFSLTHFSQNYFHSIVRVLDIFLLNATRSLRYSRSTQQFIYSRNSRNEWNFMLAVNIKFPSNNKKCVVISEISIANNGLSSRRTKWMGEAFALRADEFVAFHWVRSPLLSEAT